MYTKPRNYVQLRDYLVEDVGPQAELLLDVELGLTLLQLLDMQDEPLTVLWVILSGLEIPHHRLLSLDGDQRKWLARARVLLPAYSGRIAWERDLRSYISDISPDYRTFDFDPSQLEIQILDASFAGIADDMRHNALVDCLNTPLSHGRRSSRYPSDTGMYNFTARTIDGRAHKLRVTLDEESLSFSESQYTFPDERHTRDPICITLTELKEIAEDYDNAVGNRSWCNRLKGIQILSSTSAQALTIHGRNEVIEFQGSKSLAGIVSSGKSTFMKLVAGLGVKRNQNGGGWRTVLVVGDTQSAIQIAHELNTLHHLQPEHDTPIAVPLFGSSNIYEHAKRLYQSREYLKCVEAEQAHWGEYFLNTLCLLNAKMVEGDLEQANFLPIMPGSEPCNKLQRVDDFNTSSGHYMCPLFSICPSQTRHHAMLEAPIWIVTPGAFGQASVSDHIDDRPIRLADLIYEQADLVFFDEADTVQEWFDALYAQETILVHGGKGILEQLDTTIASFLNQNRVTNPRTLRWIDNERKARLIAERILNLLNRTQGYSELSDWIRRGHFTGLNMFMMLAKRLTGLGDFDDPPDQENEQHINRLVEYFVNFIGQDLLNRSANEHEDGILAAVQDLVNLTYGLVSTGTSLDKPSTIEGLRSWILTYVPDIEERLAAHARVREQNQARYHNTRVDTIDTLAHRLEFCLAVTLLDAYTREVFYQGIRDAPPSLVNETHLFRGVPRSLINVLPIPPTGRSFGSYYSRPLDDRPNQGTDRLSTYGYTNVGRYLLMHYSTLRLHTEGHYGPHCVSMSGTSYLPGSSQWHLHIPLMGVLRTRQTSQNALEQSLFSFIPYRDEESGKAIRVSGTEDKQQSLRLLIHTMMEGMKSSGGRFGRELDMLNDLAQTNPESWEDRQRILLIVNSYEQAQSVASSLKRQWPMMASRVSALTL